MRDFYVFIDLLMIRMILKIENQKSKIKDFYKKYKSMDKPTSVGIVPDNWLPSNLLLFIDWFIFFINQKKNKIKIKIQRMNSIGYKNFSRNRSI